MRPLMRKEKRLAIAALATLAITMAYNSLIAPALGRMETLNRVIPEKQQELVEVTQTSHQISRLQNQINDLQITTKNIAPKTALIKCVNDANLTNHQTELTQRQSSIGDHYNQTTLTLELQNVTLKQLVSLIEKSGQKNLVLKNLAIKRNKTSLNATLTITHLRSAAARVHAS